MATKIDGWVLPLPGSGGLRDWSTFTTTFPGPNSGYIKVFAMQSCCSSTDPVIQPCDVFFVEGANIILMRDFGDTEVIATGSTQYVDIAELNGKLYARKYSGYLDEYTIGPTSLTLTTPDIVSLNTGTSLASDGTYLIYDINSGPNIGKIARTIPGAWTPTFYALPSSHTLQGDILLVGGNQLAMTTFDNTSSLIVFDNNPTTPTIQSQSQIKDSTGAILSQIYSMFQKDGVIYIVRGDGTYYSMSTTYPIVFTQVGQLTINGTTQGDWNGAAQNGDCGTVIPPIDVGVTFNGSYTNGSIDQPGVIISNARLDDAIQNELLSTNPLDMSTSNTFSGATVTNSVGPYRVRFTNSGSSTSIITASILADIDGAGFTEIDNQTVPIGSNFDESYTLSPTSSINIVVLIARIPESIGYIVEIHNDSLPAVSGVTLSNVTLRGLSDIIISPYTVNLNSVPPTNTATGTADFQEANFEFEVMDIPGINADIFYSIDGAPDVFVINEAITPSSTYFRTFSQAATATTSFKLTYKFKLTT